MSGLLAAQFRNGDKTLGVRLAEKLGVENGLVQHRREVRRAHFFGENVFRMTRLLEPKSSEDGIFFHDSRSVL